jgi:hypothetical protein
MATEAKAVKNETYSIRWAVVLKLPDFLTEFTFRIGRFFFKKSSSYTAQLIHCLIRKISYSFPLDENKVVFNVSVI